MFLVGLTGGIASGKSTVVRCLVEDLNCPIIDADVIAREVVLPGTRGWRKIKDNFGSEILYSNGELNREKLGQIIFSDEKKRKVLNSITHPEIYKAILWKVVKYFLQGHRFVVLDLPLLFETKKILPYTTFTVVVSCNEEQQLQRLMARNSYTKEAAEIRIKAQMSLAEKCKLCTHIIDNSGTIESTEKQVKLLYQEFSMCKAFWKLRIIVAFCATSLLGLGLFLCHYLMT
ncbi:hypothetical protein FSP39_009256 [Pinctada imbricata]|uniref:Dephospho-CoA kinase domain-containing protein n=1 Tax=Pinctada imbricata TaxID=66713 RepID=A0AA88YM58_PINIB|nr:hypothetical protein FSP39_009256 [Pinctada imbricata]